MSALAVTEIEHVAPILDGPGASGDVRAVRHRIKCELARELHDQVAQQLTAMLIEQQVFARGQLDRPDVMDHVSFVQASTREVLNNVRQILWDLRDQPGISQGLVESIRDELLPAFTRKTGLKTSLWVSPSWPHALPPETCIQIYRIVQESINNSIKHGAATSAHVALKVQRNGQLVVTVRDDGQGFACKDINLRAGGVGIVGMKERAALLGGALQVRSRPTIGTSVTATLPMDARTWNPKTAKFAS